MNLLSLITLPLLALALAIPSAWAGDRSAEDLDTRPAEAADDEGARESGVARNCVRQTGTRLAARAARRDDARACQPGRAYDRDDIERSGAGSTAEAIRRLDPAVRIHRGG